MLSPANKVNEEKEWRADESARLSPSRGKRACLAACLKLAHQYFISHFLNLYNDAALLMSRNPEHAKKAEFGPSAAAN